jgi:GNAT superfamily N-acetyltransferase
MYARVLREGEVRPGDQITLQPPGPDSRAGHELSLGRLDRAEALSGLRTWRAAAEAGLDVRIVEDGELAMCAAPGLPGPAFNRATGLARLPNLLSQATRFFDEHQSTGWLVTDQPPWPGSSADPALTIYCAPIDAVIDERPVVGLTIRTLAADETEPWDRVHAAADSGGSDASVASPWPATMAQLVHAAHVYLLLAEQDGKPVGAAMLSTSRGAGWLRAAAVVRSARGLGIQRALISARARLAGEEGCDLLGSGAISGGRSAANLERMGFESIGRREFHRYVPPTVTT